jgi:hypothetical protein
VAWKVVPTRSLSAIELMSSQLLTHFQSPYKQANSSVQLVGAECHLQYVSLSFHKFL